MLIVGAGAVGVFYGSQLSRAGCDVSVVARSEFDVVSENGYRITSVFGDYEFKPSYVFSSIEECSIKPDLILVATKALSEIRLSKLLAPLMPAPVLLIQNGIHVEKEFHNAFPEVPLISGLAFICVSRFDSGQVTHMDYGRLKIGVYPEGRHQLADDISACFEQSSVECQVTTSIQRARWIKMVWNVPFNPLSVLNGGMTTQQILESKPYGDWVRPLMKEVQAVALAEGFDIPDSVIDKNISDTVAMKPYKTSMLLDMIAGRPLEIDAILGDYIRIAKDLLIAVPFAEQLYGDIKKIIKNLNNGKK